MSHQQLLDLSYQTLLDLSTDEGINASGKDEIYGCIFGRDSAITVLKILRAHSKKPSLKLLEICRRALLTLTTLQGQEFNLESGEEPGKFIHEFRKDKFNHLISGERPWFVYPDGFLRNYDSIDSTPLTLIALYKYWQVTLDSEFFVTVLPAVEAGLNWIITFGDLDKDLFLEYDFPINRTYGGLMIQSWTDSDQALRGANGKLPKYPIAPVEAQSFAWLALKLWADFYSSSSPFFARKLNSQAKKLKKKFNEQFLIKDSGLYFAAQALDGNKRKIKTITGNPLLCLWASYDKFSEVECILDDKYVDDFVKRVFKRDLFDKQAGVRTMSTLSKTYNPHQDSYHNGSFWPILNGLIHEGLENWGYHRQAEKLKKASLTALQYFGCPIELYIKSGRDYLEFRTTSGQTSCRSQAWSAAATLDLLTG